MENPIKISDEELEAEKSALAEVQENDVRVSIISEYGFDEIDDADKIDKLVAKEMSHKKDLSSAIGQKIKYRTELQAKSATPPQVDKAKVLSPEELDQTLDAKLNERLEKRDLEAMEYPDDIKADISLIAKAKGISVKKATSDPYIQFKIEKYNEEKEVDEKNDRATISRTHKSGGKTVSSFEEPPKVDMATEVGRAAWDKYLEEQKKLGH